MLYWICPECGLECSPAIRECPTCAAVASPAAHNKDLLSLAQNFAIGPPVALDLLALNPARPRRSRQVKLISTPVPVPIPSPSAPIAALPRKEFCIPLAGLLPGGEVRFQPARAVQPNSLEPCAEPLPSRRQSIAFVRAQLSVSGDHRGIAELLKDLAAIHAIEESFCEQPAVGLLPAPAEIVTVPPAAQWIPAQKPKFTAIAPEHAGRATMTAGPQAPPLAGPKLPPQLACFHPKDSGLRRKRKPGSFWPLSLLVATVLILGGISLVQHLTQNSEINAASVETPAQRTKSSPQIRIVEEHPAARSVEVAGVRIITGPNKRPQLQYVVINHSSTEITGLDIRIAVRSVESLVDAPLFTVASPVASLGPSQSKEIRTDLDASVAPSSIPDWHSLRTDVLVGRQ